MMCRFLITYLQGWSVTSYLIFIIFYGEFKAGKTDVNGTVIISVESSREVGSANRNSDKIVSDTLRTIILADGGNTFYVFYLQNRTTVS
jgi:hypothetical protein